MIKLLVIADDFTGALDTGIQFRAKDTRVLIGPESAEELEDIKDTVQVVIVDAETRHMAPEDAYACVFRIVEIASRIGIPYIYKKTDSALRGNIGAELSAALKASGHTQLHFIPAFPIMGRTTKEGIHYVNGTPVSESAFRNDPFNPVTVSYIPDLIGLQTEVPVTVVTKFQKEPVSCDAAGIFVYDAETFEDLNQIADILSAKDALHLAAGCAGFAAALPGLLQIDQVDNSTVHGEKGFSFFCGSVNPATTSQVAYASSNGFNRISLTNSQKVDASWIDAEGIMPFLALAKEDAPFIVESFSDQDAVPFREFASSQGLTPDDIRLRISGTLGTLLKELLDAGLSRTVMVTGGDTLLAFMNAIGVKQLIPIRELKPGVVLSQVEYNKKRISLISKSGGFGQPELLCELAEMFR